MPRRTSRRTSGENADTAMALMGGTPGARLLRARMPLEPALIAEARQRRQRWAETTRQSKAILAPLHRIIAADEGAVRAAKALRQLRPLQVAKRPRIQMPDVESQVRAGSILTIRGLPYDSEWQAGTGSSGGSTTFGGGDASKAVGRFIVSNQVASAGGSVWGAAGVAVWFRPVAPNTMVRFATYAPGSGDWNDDSWGYTAHNHAFFGVLIYSCTPAGTDWRTEVDRRIPLWDDGTGWWEEHGDQTSMYFPSDTLFNATSSRWYQVWMWAEAWCDAAGPGSGLIHFGSSAKNYMIFNSSFCVFEQWR